MDELKKPKLVLHPQDAPMVTSRAAGGAGGKGDGAKRVSEQVGGNLLPVFSLGGVKGGGGG